ncbi:outer membrane receptor protein involved in Fe transport [Aquamicrobium lusatiense]|jgi:outer membrane receptor protein involved in Fe transport|uniref:Outer membrane receptor protein involved in Fe transport n=1 Tax=Aquamicrobium lusatiense TaxID=89772 RepID=A0A7W9S827_9HYPH|nr:TonB-dependent receptor [Aquamicrobium lusatiense]MBB6014708.1 outer membrane receptor protein involved in Fe transport [Aquamicrobium lusatiense]
MASTMLALTWTVPAVAQSTAPAHSAQQPISVPAGPLTPALNRLAAQSGLQILFDADLARGKTTRGASGNLTPAQALNAVLGGTGLSARFAGGNQVVLSISAASASDTNYAASIAGATMLAPIIIYGSRDTTTLGRSASSVNVVTARDIEGGSIRTLQDSFRRMGNVMDGADANSGFVIRGMSSEGFVPGGTPVGSLYVDGVLQTRWNARRAPRSLWDVEQVEVYRGPQSTLSGRAATTGAIYIKSKDPVFEKEAALSATVGNNSRVGGAFMVNTPLVEDQIALRMSGTYERSKTPINMPTYESFARFDDFSTDLSYNIRGKLLFEPAEMPETKALLSYVFSKENPVTNFIGIKPGEYDFDDFRGDFFSIPNDAEYRPHKMHSVGLEITHDFSETLRLTSLTGLNDGATVRKSIETGEPGYSTSRHGTVDDTLLSQELRLNYEADRWQWVAGLYGSYQSTDSDLIIVAPFSPLPLARQHQTIYGRTTNLAVFGEATYEFVPTWDVTLGGRLDYLRSRDEAYVSVAHPVTGTVLASGSGVPVIEEVHFVPKVGISKSFDDNHRVGLTYSQGFRSGGYYINTRSRAVFTYEPEKAHSFELFYKGRLLDDRLALNANLFLTQYKDQQIEVRPDPFNAAYRETRNAAESRAWGFEIEPTWQVTPAFSAFASIGYLNAKFERFDLGPTYGDLSGERLPNAPEWTVGFGGRYDFDNGFYVGADAKYTSGSKAIFGVAPQDSLDSRFIVNAQIGFVQDNWEINVFAENLLDEIYFTGTDVDAIPAYAQLGPRRSVGLNVKARF